MICYRGDERYVSLIERWTEWRKLSAEKPLMFEERIVFTNGCFDLFHPGHLRVIERAREAAGDYGRLFVGVNTDWSVRLLKGLERPVMDQSSRARIVHSLKGVDHVILFDEETPLELIRDLRPNVIVKGAEYDEAAVVGRDFVSDVRLCEMDDRWSTTKLIERIRGSVS